MLQNFGEFPLKFIFLSYQSNFYTNLLITGIFILLTFSVMFYKAYKTNGTSQFCKKMINVTNKHTVLLLSDFHLAVSNENSPN